MYILVLDLALVLSDHYMIWWDSMTIGESSSEAQPYVSSGQATDFRHMIC